MKHQLAKLAISASIILVFASAIGLMWLAMGAASSEPHGCTSAGKVFSNKST